MSRIHPDQLVSSPACIPQLPLDEVLPIYAGLGFRKFEAFTSWCQSHLDPGKPAADYKAAAAQHGMAYTSLHLPPITDDFDRSLAAAVAAARFAAELGARVVLYKANSRENYIRGAKPFLDAIEREGVAVTPVLQNHKGTPITTPDDFLAVIRGIDDPRMKTLLEVGHFQRVGVSWREGAELLGDSVALVHINDIDETGQSVPFGTGRVDFPGLFDHLAATGYRGEIVVELELTTRDKDVPRTVHYLGEALAYLREHCMKENA